MTIKKLLSIIFLTWGIFFSLQAQDKAIKGHVYTPQKQPLKGIKITSIDDPKIAVYTNKYGYFFIDGVSPKSRLLIIDPQDIWQSEIVEIENKNYQTYILKSVISPLLAYPSDTLGVAVLGDQTPVLSSESRMTDIRQIKSLQLKKNTYRIKKQPESKLKGYKVEYVSSVSLSQVGQLPEIPPAYTDNAADFFRNAFSFQNKVSVKMPLYNFGKLFQASLGQQKNNSPIPNAYQETYNGSLSLNKIQIGAFTSELGISGKSYYNRLMNDGATHAGILHSALTSDNTNETSQFINKLPNRNKAEELLTYLNTKYEKKNILANFNAGFNKQWDNKTAGIAFDNKIHKKEQLSNLQFYGDIKYKVLEKYRNELNIQTAYKFSQTQNEIDLQQMNSLGIPDVFQEKARNAHDLTYELNWRKRDFFLAFKNKHYFSTTAKDYINLFPYLGSYLYLDNDFFYDVFNKDIDSEVKLFGSISRSLGEAPLVYRNLAILTTNMNPNVKHYENRAILFGQEKMTPETYVNSEIGASADLLDRKLLIEFSYFHNTTQDMIAPIHTGNPINPYKLENIGKTLNYGYLLNSEFNLVSRRYSYYDYNFRLNFGFSKIKSKVTNVANEGQLIPLAGFRNVGTFFVKGEPLGVIYGTTYKRNEEGKLIIGDNGFPLVDENNLKKLGDPTPDFVLHLSPRFHWKKFNFSFSFEYSHGGDRWNGTKAELDRLSKGELPAEEYIENASFLRLSNVSAQYRLIDNQNKFIKKVTLGLQGQNLLFLSSYQGVDPASTLYGYSTGKGLDFFNMPSIRSYEFSVNIEF